MPVHRRTHLARLMKRAHRAARRMRAHFATYRAALANRRSRSNAGSVDRVEERMLAAMLAHEETRHDTPLGTVSVCRNSARPVELLADEEDLPERVLRRTTSVDKRELSDALKADDPEALAVARFGEAGHHLRIS